MENIPDTPEGIILESLLEGMAEYYSAELSQKVLRGLNESYLKGNYHPDKIIVTMNFTDTCDPPQMTPESIKEIEKQSASETAFSLKKSSYTLSSFSANTKDRPLGWSFVLAERRAQ